MTLWRGAAVFPGTVRNVRGAVGRRHAGGMSQQHQNVQHAYTAMQPPMDTPSTTSHTPLGRELALHALSTAPKQDVERQTAEAGLSQREEIAEAAGANPLERALSMAVRPGSAPPNATKRTAMHAVICDANGEKCRPWMGGEVMSN